MSHRVAGVMTFLYGPTLFVLLAPASDRWGVPETTSPRDEADAGRLRERFWSLGARSAHVGAWVGTAGAGETQVVFREVLHPNMVKLSRRWPRFTHEPPAPTSLATPVWVEMRAAVERWSLIDETSVFFQAYLQQKRART